MCNSVHNTSCWDVIIIGGGASGLWCAYDAALRGYQTLLVEQGDFASATSSKSTKLIHGGIRYLKQGHISLVREALQERKILSEIAPHLVQSRQFIIPYAHWWERWYYGLGMTLYDYFSGPMGQEPHRSLSSPEALTHCPTLLSDNLHGGCLFSDGQFDDARFAIEIAKMAATYRATLLNYARVTKFSYEKDKICGVVIRDELTENQWEVRGKCIINATGIYTDEMRKLADPTAKPMMALSQGAHIVLDASFLPRETALVIPKTKDKRLAFLIPWHGKILLGTTDIPTPHPTQEAHPTQEEIDFLLDAASTILNKKPTREDIRSIFAGIRPLVKRPGATSKLLRSHKIALEPSGMITLTGGKWTTARKMAEETLNFAIQKGNLENRLCQTHKTPFKESVHLHKGQLLHPDLPYTEDDIEIAIEHEMAMTLVDLLSRRTRSLLLDVRATQAIAPKVAHTLQKRLGKSDAWKYQQIEEFLTISRSYLP